MGEREVTESVAGTGGTGGMAGCWGEPWRDDDVGSSLRSLVSSLLSLPTCRDRLGLWVGGGTGGNGSGASVGLALGSTGCGVRCEVIPRLTVLITLNAFCNRCSVARGPCSWRWTGGDRTPLDVAGRLATIEETAGYRRS